MNIIIDTNIVRRDLKLKDRNFEIILDYLKKTASELILPQIAFEEIKGLYRRLLLDKVEELQKAHEKLNATLTTSTLQAIKAIDIDKESNDYESFLLKRLNLKKENIIKYKNEYLPELVKRAIERQKPLNGSGQQFRDGLIWLTILDYADKLTEKRLIFISDNKSDFSEKSQNCLNQQLKQEADTKGINIIYYHTIADFVKEQASKITFVTDTWIEANIDLTKLEKLFEEAIKTEDQYILEQVKSGLERSEIATGYIKPTSYITSKITEHYVYEMLDGTILLNLEVEIEKEYEIEVEKEVEKDKSDYEYETSFNPLTGLIEVEHYFVPRIELTLQKHYKYECPLFLGKFVITIKNTNLTNYEFKGWNFG